MKQCITIKNSKVLSYVTALTFYLTICQVNLKHRINLLQAYSKLI